MDWDSLYPFIESRAAVAYDCNDEFNNLAGDNIFIDPYGWYVNYLNITDHLRSIIELLEDHGDELPDDVGTKDEAIEFVNQYFTDKFTQVISSIEKKLLMDAYIPSTIIELNTTAETLYELISIFVNNSQDDIESKEMVAKYDEKNDNILTETFNFHQEDAGQIYETIMAIRDIYDEEE